MNAIKDDTPDREPLPLKEHECLLWALLGASIVVSVAYIVVSFVHVVAMQILGTVFLFSFPLFMSHVIAIIVASKMRRIRGRRAFLAALGAMGFVCLFLQFLHL